MADHHQYCSGDFQPDDVVISGISGRFPQCKNIGELKEALFTSKYVLFETFERYDKGASDLPFGSPGTISDIDKFDAGYFGYFSKVADTIEPTQRLLLEVSYEAIVDAGYDPTNELNGANIGVYSAISNEDAKLLVATQGIKHATLATGYIRTMAANRCSYHFDFTGPSITMDSACSSSLVALNAAYFDVLEGRVEAALVNAGQLCLHPIMTKYYMDGGIISRDCRSSPFDEKSNGIVRSETITALFLQKASVARRAYTNIVHMKNASSGYVPEGISVPSYPKEVKLFESMLKETKIDPKEIQFVETHGTSTQIGDPIEIKALETVFCKGREEPLYVGSVKSNVGHSEASAGLSGAIKAIFAFESGLIPPNQNFEKANPNCEAIVNGTIKVVAEAIPLTSQYIPVNSFGFGGSICQAMFKRNAIEYSNFSTPEDMPRLVLFPGNTEDAVIYAFDYIQNHPELKSEFFALLNKLSFTSTKRKPFRGYALFQNDNPITQIKNIQTKKEREVWFIMTGMGCQWPGMGLEMMQIKIFADSMKKSAEVLKTFRIDLFELLKKDEQHLLKDRSITPAFVTIASIQIALVDVLRALEIHPDHIIGHSTGELICAYADGCFTAEQAITSAYWRGVCMENSNLESGLMAAVGLTWEECVSRCPKDVYPACHNADDSVTISGLKEPLEKFVAELQAENVFARVVNAYGYACHCKHIWSAAKELKEILLKVIPEPKPRTERWITTSYPEEEWNKDDCKMAGAEYFVHNLMSTVLFRDALKRIPSDACIVEIGPHFLLKSILKRSVGSDASYVGLMKRNDDNNIGFFMESLGKLYLEGLNPKIENLYRPVQFPVPRGTPQISDLIQWDHSQSHYAPKFKYLSAAYAHTFETDGADSYLLDHFIDGKAFFPATGFVWLAWKALTKRMQCKNIEDINIRIEDFKIHRATILRPATSFHISILESTGTFEITESENLVASGRIYREDNIQFCEAHRIFSKGDQNASNRVSGEDIYAELRIAGYEYGPAFRRLVETSFDGHEGFVEWKDDWITFLDALLLFFMFTNKDKSFVLPTGALSFKICPEVLQSSVEESFKKGLPGIPVNFYKDTNICRTAGIEIRSLEVDSVSQRKFADACVFEEYKFVPYVHNYLPLNKDQELEKYTIACNTVIDKLQERFDTVLTTEKFETEQKIDFNIDDYINEPALEMKLLTELKAIASVGELNDISKEFEIIFNRYVQDIGKDMLNNLLSNEYCLRYMFEVILENTHQKMNVLEINRDTPLILPKVVDFMEGFARLKFQKKILVCKDIEQIDENKMKDCDINVHSCEILSSLVQEKNQQVIISTINISTIKEAQEHIQLINSIVDQRGFILLFHKNCLLPPENLLALLANKDINIVSQFNIENCFKEEGLVTISKISHEICGNLYLLRPKMAIESENIVRLSEDNPTWLDQLKDSVVKENKKTWVVSEDCSSSGIVGLINCLRQEPNGEKLRCVFIPRKSKGKNPPPPFSFSDPFFRSVLEKDLVFNIYKDGCWGSFSHIKIDTDLQNEEVDHSYVNIKRYGDLSSFVWMESALNYMKIKENELVHIYYSALNFKDVMLATGKISPETAKRLTGSDNCILGFEFSGKNQNGERIAGICKSRGIATATQTYPDLIIRVPDNWSLEDAATVPVVYATCYYGLIIRVGLKHGDSILIHSGAGGIGQAAINIALSMNCEVYTTVGTEQKRKYILEHFPAIKSENIGCSRDISFENMIMKRTNGKGVKVVLNSLADEKFYASIRCVANGGKFVEIGKYDLALDHKIGLKRFLNNIAFHGVFLDNVMVEDETTMREIIRLIHDGIKSGVVKPLDRTVFQRDDVEKAFRYMAGGTHIGKVLLKIRDEEDKKFHIPTKLCLPAIPVTYFYPHKVYIIVGGLGGFGIEVAKWLLQKGARNLVLTTRYGARTPYHHLCLKRWEEDGYNVIVSKRDVSVRDDAAKLLKEVASIGPVGGIFNSAIILHDAFLENTNFQHFKEVCAPKADATRHLDSLSRCLCPELDHFVCFSSISCGRGNAGQMNYGYANSVMERVCEERQADGYPGLTIEWGIIGEVGVVHRHMGDDAMISGIVAQKVKSCLNILDISCQLKKPVVCSYVSKDLSLKAGERGDVLQQLARILGLKDLSEFSSVRSFGEMGVDSIVGIEMKNLLETTCDITLSMKEVQELNIDQVKALIEKAESEKNKSSSTALVSTSSAKLPKSIVHSETIILLNEEQNGVPLFILDIDSDNIANLKKLAILFPTSVYGLMWSNEVNGTNLESIASYYLEKVKEITQKEARLVAHGSSSLIALEMLLQNQKSKSVFLSLAIMNGYSYLQEIANKDRKSSDIDILCDFVENYIPSSRIRLKEQLSGMTNFEQQVRAVVDLFTRCSIEAVNKAELTDIITAGVQKLKLLKEYTPADKLSGDLLVIEDSAKLLANDIADAKMALTEICTGKITIQRTPDIAAIREENIQKVASTLISALDYNSLA